jgi:hypothetical protein
MHAHGEAEHLGLVRRIDPLLTERLSVSLTAHARNLSSPIVFAHKRGLLSRRGKLPWGLEGSWGCGTVHWSWFLYMTSTVMVLQLSR